MDDPAGQTNITRALEALSPYLNNPRQTVVRIEAFVGLAAALLFLQLVLGAKRRRSGHWSVQGCLWLCYTFSFPLIAYTTGQMVSSPIKNGLYPLWAVLLFWAAGCADSVTVYALEESKQWTRILFEMFQYTAYSSVMIRLISRTPDTSSSYFNRFISREPHAYYLVVLSGTLISSSLARVVAGWKVTNPYSSKVVADHMRDLVDRRETFDPITLKGCRYIVTFFDITVIGKGPTYRNVLDEEGIVTINTIWESKDPELDDRLKDVCLSFALSRLLKRRFYGMECAEAQLPETRNFVLRGLLKQEDKENNYARAFQIIEVELGFLYDFLFTKYAAFSPSRFFLLLALVRLILISICGEYVLRGSFTIKTSKPVIEVGTTKADVTITLVIIATLMLVEALQVIVYVASDWATVSLACCYTRSEIETRRRKLIGSIISCIDTCRKLIGSIISCLGRFSLSRTKSGRFLQSFNLFGYWQNKMGQSSLIQSCWHVNLITGRFEQWTAACFALIDMIHPSKKFVPVPDLVKIEIVSCLRERSKKGGALTNGKEALRNGNFYDFVAVLDSGSQAMIMLIWHIATEYCDIASPDEADQRDHRRVATILSRYCAYLMSFIPDLLPGNSTDTTFVNRAVLIEANELLQGRKPITKDILVAAIPTDSTSNNNEDTVEQGSTSDNNEDTIFIKGLKIGRALEDKGVGHWKILAEFWAETIIFIAPSDNVNVHMERLAQGGEFLTHIWALLNHAGILKRDQDLAPEVDL